MEKVLNRIKSYPFLGIVMVLTMILLPASRLCALEKNPDFGVGYLLEIKGAIGPAVADYVVRGIEKADETKAKLIVLQMDTPGGLSKSMRDINKAILASTVPVVTYVSPSGARAASAGTYILYASHFAVMAPGTNLGAATPVSIGMSGSGSSKDEKGKNESTMEHKAISDATAYIRSLAQLRGRNVEWAVQAVVKAESLSATEAFQKKVISFIADNNQDLLNKLNGRDTEVAGKTITMQTENTTLEQIKPDWRTRFLTVITDPSVAYLLLLVGAYGLFLEFTNPGVIVPGVLGTIALLIALYAFQLLPISYVGLGLILLGICFMGAEVFITSNGILAIGGLIAFVLGSVMLMDTNEAGFGIPLSLIAAVSAFTSVFILLILRMVVRSRRTPEVTGVEELLVSEGVVEAIDGNRYHVRIKGEVWQAESQSTLVVGQVVAVKALHGLVLQVDPINSMKGESL